MLPDICYESPKEQVSERLLRIYDQGSLSMSQRMTVHQPANLIHLVTSGANQTQVTAKEMQRVMKNDKITHACVVETRNTNEQLTYLNSQQQYN